MEKKQRSIDEADRSAGLAGILPGGLAAGLKDPAFIMFAVALVSGTLLRFFHLGDPIGGYHGYNEAFYSLNARYYLTHPISGLFTSPVDINNPPLTNLLIYISYLIFGVSEWSGRLVMVLAGILSIVYIYKLAGILFGPRVGGASALLLAVSPGFLLIGRNIQTDALFIFFTLAGLYHFVLAKRTGEGKQFLFSALFFGLGMLSKVVTAIVLILLLALEIKEQKGIGFLRQRNYAIFVGFFLVISVPWFLFQTLTGTLFQGQTGLASSAFSPPDMLFFLNSFIQEPMWGLSPFLFALLPIAFYVMGRERSEGDQLVLFLIGLFLAFYLFFHFHSYYMVPYIPFALIGIARSLEKLFGRSKGYEVAIAGTAFVSMLFAIFLVSGLKYGHGEFAELRKVIPPEQKDVVVETTEGLWGSYYPIIKFYLPNVQVAHDDPKDFPKDKTVYYVDFARIDLDPSELPPGQELTVSDLHLPVIFGQMIYQRSVGTHFLRTEAFLVRKYQGPQMFGIVELQQAGLIVQKVHDAEK